MATKKAEIRAVRGKPWSELEGKIPLNKSTLRRLGFALVKHLKRESAKDFAKRGWSGRDPMGGPPIWKSFTFHVDTAKQDVIISSSFYGMAELARGDIPSRKMDWLTQAEKYDRPGDFALTKGERERGMKKYDRPPNPRLSPAERKKEAAEKRARGEGSRLPLIVPVESGGTVVFRMAPWTTADAWIHPGIAKFTFFRRAIEKGRKEIAEIIAKEVVKELAKGDPTR